MPCMKLSELSLIIFFDNSQRLIKKHTVILLKFTIFIMMLKCLPAANLCLMHPEHTYLFFQIEKEIQGVEW